MTCSTFAGASRGWSFVTLCAAHSDEHSRVQLQEQTAVHSVKQQIREEVTGERERGDSDGAARHVVEGDSLLFVGGALATRPGERGDDQGGLGEDDEGQQTAAPGVPANILRCRSILAGGRGPPRGPLRRRLDRRLRPRRPLREVPLGGGGPADG